QGSYSEYSDWNLLGMQLVSTANHYMKENKRPMVLILDQVDRIAKKDLEFLRILQDFAKDCADLGSLDIIFVASEGIVPQIMKSRSSWSRASILFEVGNISDEEAIGYLKDSGINQKIIETVVKYLTGGRFALLKQFQLLNKVNGDPNILLEIHHIDIEQAQTIISLDMLHKLVECNILKENEDCTVSFHSRYVDTYFKEQNERCFGLTISSLTRSPPTVFVFSTEDIKALNATITPTSCESKVIPDSEATKFPDQYVLPVISTGILESQCWMMEILKIILDSIVQWSSGGKLPAKCLNCRTTDCGGDS
ncbi:3823_t:CDS:2, partial [Diversispora eburnea]